MSIKIQKLLLMKTYSFYEYLPQKRQKSDTPEVFGIVRRLVLNFKDGRKFAQEHVTKLVSDALTMWYGSGNADLVLVCVPTANEKKYGYRFRRFAAAVSARTGIQNGTAQVQIFGSRSAKHTDSCHVVRESDDYKVVVNAEFFKGKSVIIFDDIRTTGKSAGAFAAELESMGATIKGGLFLAQSIMYV